MSTRLGHIRLCMVELGIVLLASGIEGRCQHATLEDNALRFGSRSDCERLYESSGFSGGTTISHEGTWRRIGDNKVELRWTRRSQDTEVGWSRDQSSDSSDWMERVMVGWEDGRSTEVCFSRGALPSTSPASDRYLPVRY